MNSQASRMPRLRFLTCLPCHRGGVRELSTAPTGFEEGRRVLAEAGGETTLSNQENQSPMHDLLQLARERGYLLMNELNKVLPVSDDSTEQIDELFSVLERDGVEVYEDAAEELATNSGAGNAPQHEFKEEDTPSPGRYRARPDRTTFETVKRPGPDVLARNGHCASVDP